MGRLSHRLPRASLRNPNWEPPFRFRGILHRGWHSATQETDSPVNILVMAESYALLGQNTGTRLERCCVSTNFVHPSQRKRQRALMILAAAILLAGAAALVLTALRDSIVFFFGPTELIERGTSLPGRIRLGGLVAEATVREGDTGFHTFEVTDLESSVQVVYQGALPDLFREGQGVVAEGQYSAGTLHADRILAKHDENYMPREVANALKKAGTWREPDS